MRFSLELPVSYRSVSAGEWRAGTTLEVSASGAVVRVAPESTGFPSAVILVITLPFGDGCLVGKGHIARGVARRPEHGTIDVAVAVGEFQIVHRPAVTAAADSLLQQDVTSSNLL